MAKADPTPTPAQPEKAPKKYKPTPEQLRQLQKGGDYRFNAATGKLVQTRKPAVAPGTKEAK